MSRTGNGNIGIRRIFLLFVPVVVGDAFPFCLGNLLLQPSAFQLQLFLLFHTLLLQLRDQLGLAPFIRLSGQHLRLSLALIPLLVERLVRLEWQTVRPLFLRLLLLQRSPLVGYQRRPRAHRALGLLQTSRAFRAIRRLRHIFFPPV